MKMYEMLLFFLRGYVDEVVDIVVFGFLYMTRCGVLA